MKTSDTAGREVAARMKGQGLALPVGLATLLVAFAASVVFSMWAGALNIPFLEILDALLGNEVSAINSAVVLKVRLPRAAVAALVGAALGGSGVSFQAVLRNPLADPYLLGVSGGAALGAVTVITFGGANAAATLVPVAAFMGAMGALGVVYLVASAQRASTYALILSGVMVGSFCSALLLFFLWMAPADTVRTAFFWLSGNLSEVAPDWFVWTALLAMISFGALWLQAPALDLFTQGEEVAADLGLDVGRARLTVFLAAGALAASAVAVAGLVGFVGLVAPHVVRLFWGGSHRRLLPGAAILGATFILFSDGIARTVFAPAEIPVGVVTALIGAPFFLLLLRRRGQQQ